MFKRFHGCSEEGNAGFSINRMTLAFRNAGLEKRFQRSYLEGNLQLSRACHLLAIFFYWLVGLWDALVIDPSRLHIWIWVILAVTLIFLSGLTASYAALKLYARYWQPLFAFYVFMTGTGFTMVTVLSRPSYPVYNFMGIIFCLFFCYTFIRLIFVWALTAGNAIVLIYSAATWIFVGPPIGVLLTHFFYMSGINLLGMMVCYSLELMSRRDFMLNRLLTIERNKTRQLNDRLEQRVEERTEELRVSEETFKGFFNQSNIGMAITSLDKRWLIINEKLCSMFGYSKTELAKMTWTEMTYPDDLEPDLVEFRKLISGETDGYEREMRFIKKDNSLIFTHMTVSCLHREDGSIDKILATFQDISHQKQAEIEKEKLEEQLRQAQKLESIGRLAGGVAHDYNNMSSIIIGYAELALENVTQEEPLYQDLEEILTAARRSTDITRQLLAFARKQTIAPKTLDLNDTIENMLKMLGRLIGEDIELVWLPKEKTWPVSIDPSQIDQILANLCVNARDAIADVGRITIETNNISLDEAYCANHAGFIPGDFVLLAVSDNGGGIKPDVMDQIFEPFFTTKGLGKGTGLGLSTVYGIVKQNNGFINACSEPGSGTTIKIYLPRHKGQVDSFEGTAIDTPVSQNETVLLVEDDEAILKLGRRILENLGYQVLACASPLEALKLADTRDDPPDLLITDVIMPEMNGRELSETLKNRWPDLKVLYISGYTANVIAHRGLLDDDVFFLSKPFSKQDMAVKIREILDLN